MIRLNRFATFRHCRAKPLYLRRRTRCANLVLRGLQMIVLRRFASAVGQQSQQFL
jgi:hypothetical protein